MWVKSIFVICIQAILLQAVQTQCIPPLITSEALLPSNMALEAWTPVLSRIIGANLIVDTSAAEPSGVTIFSDDIFIEGTVLVTGKLPFMGTVALEGIVPATGTSAVSYECGTANVGIADTLPTPGSTILSSVPALGATGVINRLGTF